jgi:hypothetical protein
MKKLLTVIAICLCTGIFTGCLTTSALTEEDYKEILAKDFANLSTDNRFKDTKGYKITQTYISKSSYHELGFYKRGGSSPFFKLDDYSKFLSKSGYNIDNLNYAIKSEEFNGNFTVYLHREFNLNLFEYEVIIDKIEGIPSTEEVEEAKRIAEEKEKAEKEAKRLANRKVYNEEGKQLAKGYIYHGIDEVETNIMLLQSGATEKGHAYYIPGFSPYKHSPSSMGYIYTQSDVDELVLKLFGLGYLSNNTSKAFYVKYKNDSVKTEIVKATYPFKNYEHCAVVIAAPENSWSDPVVLGMIKSASK